jgi:hypothetical protein
MQLARQPLCDECSRANMVVPATDVDHVHGWATEQEFYRGPLQSLCHVCHSRKTAGEVFPRGGEIVSTRGAQSVRGLEREKESPMETIKN